MDKYRRRLFKYSFGAGLLYNFPFINNIIAQNNCSTQTPTQPAGPFFKINSPKISNFVKKDSDIKKIKLMGKIMNSRCIPIHNAIIDFWHCDSKGIYDNENFLFRGHQETSKSGKYFLETLFPGIYPGRTPHIHVKITTSKGVKLVTQLYFINHPLNINDPLFDERLIMSNVGNNFSYDFFLKEI
tara:strand:+ start:238 stop:792 length:555 start_codon:yes stop_codon:yes gene_type:complete